MIRKLILAALLAISTSGAYAQQAFDFDVRIGIAGTFQYGIPPFRHSGGQSIAGAVSYGYGPRLYVLMTMPGTSHIQLGVQIGSHFFRARSGDRESMLYQRYADADRYYTTVREPDRKLQMDQIGFMVGYIIRTTPFELSAQLGLNVGSLPEGARYAVYRKRKGENYSEEIKLTSPGGSAGPEFFYPSLRLMGSTKLVGNLFFTAGASVHAGRFSILYSEVREGLFGERASATFSEHQTVLHAGLEAGIELRVGRHPKRAGSSGS